jgi:uncharacterized protein YdhG (YjbR/CyaY superfamily)
MAKEITTVDDYIAAQPENVRDILERVRKTIRRAVPKAEEKISYKIPAYMFSGRPVLYFAAWKQFYSIYPATGRVLAAFREELASRDVRKSTIRFAFDEPVPVGLIGRIAKFRAKEEAERSKPGT